MTLTTLSTGFLPVPAAAADGPGAVQGQDLDALLGQTDAGNPDDSAQPADFGILLQALLLAQTAQPLFTVPSPAVVSGQTVSSMTVSTSVSVEQLVLSDLGNDCAKPTSDSTPPECKGDGTVDAQPLPLARKNPWISATADLAAEEVDISDPSVDSTQQALQTDPGADKVFTPGSTGRFPAAQQAGLTLVSLPTSSPERDDDASASLVHRSDLKPLPHQPALTPEALPGKAEADQKSLRMAVTSQTATIADLVPPSARGADPQPMLSAVNVAVLRSTTTTWQRPLEITPPPLTHADAASAKKPEPGNQLRSEKSSFTPATILPPSTAPLLTEGRSSQPAPASSSHGPPPVAEQVALETTRQAQLIRRGETTEFSLRLNPPELGTVHVHLRATEGGLSARFVVADEGARQALEGQMQALRLRLGEAGISLGSFDVFQRQQGSHPGWQEPETPRPVRAGVPAAKSGPLWLQSGALGVDRVDVVA